MVPAIIITILLETHGTANCQLTIRLLKPQERRHWRIRLSNGIRASRSLRLNPNRSPNRSNFNRGPTTGEERRQRSSITI